MPEQTSNGMLCHEFDILLADAFDGILSGSQLDRFQAHARACPACGPLFADAEAGENILASTTGIATSRLRHLAPSTRPPTSWLERLQASIAGLVDPIWATVRQPRFAMSFGMAFFSLSAVLSIAGIKPADVRQVSVRPAAIRHAYYNTQARVIRYYENIRFVYEVESRVREFKRATTPAEPAPEKQKERKNDTSGEPEQKQERNYSQSDSHLILASAPLGPSDDLPVVSVTTYRRFV